MAAEKKAMEGEILFYRTPEGATKVEVLYEAETFWLNQKRIADLFGVDVRTISEHLQNIFNTGELQPEATIRKIRRVQLEGNREVSFVRFQSIFTCVDNNIRIREREASVAIVNA